VAGGLVPGSAACTGTVVRARKSRLASLLFLLFLPKVDMKLSGNLWHVKQFISDVLVPAGIQHEQECPRRSRSLCTDEAPLCTSCEGQAPYWALRYAC
jgi:hypothetical protein